MHVSQAKRLSHFSEIRRDIQSNELRITRISQIILAVARRRRARVRTAKRLQLTGTLRRLRRLLFRSVGRRRWFVLRLLRRTWRRRGSGALGAGSELGAFFQPRFIILRWIHQQRPFHSVVAQAAQLAANNFVAPSFQWREPDRNERTGNCVARDSHAW